MNSPLISIVVPVYNAEKYIDRCISSICNQTYTNFELILVDDGSTDLSGSICNEYSSRDNRIRVIHKPNGGVSSARNCGLDKISGKYVTFVDSDDHVSSDFLANFVCCLSDEKNIDLVAQSFWYCYEESKEQQLLKLPDIFIKENYQLVKWFEDAKNVHNGYIWHRLFRSEIIKANNIRFPDEISFSEDGIFFVRYLRTASNFLLTSKPGYFYSVRSGSLTSTWKKLPLEVLLKTIIGYIESLNEFDVPLEKRKEHIDFSKRYVWRLIEGWVVRRCANDKDIRKEGFRKVYSLCKEYDYANLYNVSYSLKILAWTFNIKNSKLRECAVLSALFLRDIELKLVRKLKYDKH